MTTQSLFDKLWLDYTQRTPAAKNIYDLFIAQGEQVVNDHIAYRTVNRAEINIDHLAKAFLAVGYTAQQDYQFADKHLVARHFTHPDFPDAPRVFISQLMLEDFEPWVAEIFEEKIKLIDSQTIQPENLVTAGTAWGSVSFGTYNRLRQVSEYAAWFYAFGFRANHFTVSINALKKYDTIEKVNEFLKTNGYPLNTSGGEIKGTKAELLRQSSTLAAIQDVEFEEGIFQVPTCYYEFADVTPMQNGKLYGGFIAQSADKIFESTNFYQ